jgi:hypothetical protein
MTFMRGSYTSDDFIHRLENYVNRQMISIRRDDVSDMIIFDFAGNLSGLLSCHDLDSVENVKFIDTNSMRYKSCYGNQIAYMSDFTMMSQKQQIEQQEPKEVGKEEHKNNIRKVYNEYCMRKGRLSNR